MGKVHNNVSLRETLFALALTQYGAEAEYLWRTAPDAAVLRHADNRKWYAVFMLVERQKLGLSGTGKVDIMNVKCDPVLHSTFVAQPGFLPGYHMHHGHWLSVMLDGSVDKETAIFLLNSSFDLTASRTTHKQFGITRYTEWLVPANPKYYDIERQFNEHDVIYWKQSSNIAVDDTVYIYVAAPSSALRYKCRVLEVNIPREYEKGDLRIKRVMRIQCLRKYEPHLFGRDKLREFGISAVRGPRHMPSALSQEIARVTENEQAP
ncbi:MmcQ/YjbR family DNA-binding protein [Necropsobacter massiliensis]|uniref:MmcQ/YjbR family DNA-binding protein n=1 Tax=Necropsobacter massiliensis TaxID=1400001 RepID=UPI00065FE6D7|nr:MmcQ/YjbR family DNA-binding protein [Necropsobacter massiliensis]